MTSFTKVKEEIKTSSIDDVVQWLEELGSSQDPIIYKGRETTPVDLSYKIGWGVGVTSLRISFYGALPSGGFGLRKNSTFARMVKDRIDYFEGINREKKRQSRKPVVEYTVTWKEWQGNEPCGKSDHSFHKKVFISRTEAKAFFVQTKRQHSHVWFRKITNELLGESGD